MAEGDPQRWDSVDPESDGVYSIRSTRLSVGEASIVNIYDYDPGL